MCPLLPWAFIAYAWGKQPGEARWMVPWAITRNPFYVKKMGIGLKRVRRLAFEMYKMSGVSEGVREAWLRGLVERGVSEDDFPPGKKPLDFAGALCHDAALKGEEV